MSRSLSYDVVVVGAGPNGLAAGIVLARAGYSVVIFEAAPQPGGGMRSASFTRPGFIHDICSTVHALGVSSPFLRSLPLAQYGLEWVIPQIPLAHPLGDDQAVILERSVKETSHHLGLDALNYRRLMDPFVDKETVFFKDILAPPWHWPHDAWTTARFGFYGIQSSNGLSRRLFQGQDARALFSGLCAHANRPLDQSLTGAFGLLLAVAGHTNGWPFARGGSGNLSQALTLYFQSLGGHIKTNHRVTSLQELPRARVIMGDITPRQLLALASKMLPEDYKNKLRNYRYGPGVFKIDWALAGPIPWHATACARAGTVHIGGTLQEIARSEWDVWKGNHPKEPFVILTQPSLCDGSRAPDGHHTASAYCHVPLNSTVNMTHVIESQIERFAQGFCGLVLARHIMTTSQLENHNANIVGGDINGGLMDLPQFLFRPTPRWDPYSTPCKGLYLCSSSTPPGGGVHGMCGYYAAQSVLRREFGWSKSP